MDSPLTRVLDTSYGTNRYSTDEYEEGLVQHLTASTLIGLNDITSVEKHNGCNCKSNRVQLLLTNTDIE